LFLASALFLTACQDIVGPESTSLNFRAPNAVDEREANLSYTYLTRVEISSANTAGAILHGAMMPNGEIHD
jgi:uncharacterized protein YjbI with pentapeptide repeats